MWVDAVRSNGLTLVEWVGVFADLRPKARRQAHAFRGLQRLRRPGRLADERAGATREMYPGDDPAHRGASLVVSPVHPTIATQFDTGLERQILMQIISRGVYCAALSLSVLAYAASAGAQGDGDVEAKLVAMLKNATLMGTWAPVQGGQLGGEKKDQSYRIARATKGEDGQWNIVSVFTIRDRQVEFPISASVKFAGDTAVLILNDVKASPGNANWSARILFLDDVYTGRWWETANKEHGGAIS